MCKSVQQETMTKAADCMWKTSLQGKITGTSAEEWDGPVQQSARVRHAGIAADRSFLFLCTARLERGRDSTSSEPACKRHIYSSTFCRCFITWHNRFGCQTESVQQWVLIESQNLNYRPTMTTSKTIILTCDSDGQLP